MLQGFTVDLPWRRGSVVIGPLGIIFFEGSRYKVSNSCE
jgi:hypothetical protein